MDKKRVIEFIEQSFLSSLIKDEDITDISFNGKDIFFQHNLKGRNKFVSEYTYADCVDFIRHISNLCETQFSFSEPILDITISNYRINAVHSSIGRKYDDKVISFSIRIASKVNRVMNDNGFMSKEIANFIENILIEKNSIVIGGTTGCGKTELQKYLIQKMANNTRIIVIDNVQELDLVSPINDIDFTCWKSDESRHLLSNDNLIKNALRSNPDWLIIAESRGKEMKSILDSAMSGHPIITTIHCNSIEQMPSRITRMIQLNNTSESYDRILCDVVNTFRYFIFLEKTTDNGQVRRFISKIGVFYSESNKMKVIYEN